MVLVASDRRHRIVLKLIKANKRKPRAGRKPAEKKKVSSTSKAKKAAVTGKQKAAPAVAAPPATPIATSNKINISNLPLDVKEPEIRVCC